MDKTRILLLSGLVLVSGCRSLATRALADSLSGTGSGFSSDEDPRLVEAAVPFGLKTMEQVLADQPRHVGLLLALASGFTQYAYAFVQQEADRLEERDIASARALRARAFKLFLRARGYGLRALEVRHAGLGRSLKTSDPAALGRALAVTKRADVPLLYWTAAAWALAISDAKDDLALVGELPAVEALMARALELDEGYDEGAIHEFYIAYYGGRSEAEGGGPKRAGEHLERARRLGQNKKLGPLVSYAETVSVANQNREEFRRLLGEALQADVNRAPPYRLANIIAQERARWLLGRESDLFAD